MPASSLNHLFTSAAVRQTLCWALVALSLPGCGGTGAARGRDAALVVGRLTEPASLDPLYLQGSDAADVGALLYSRLTRYDARGTIVPDVAAAVPSVANGGISRDGTRIVFRLRRDVRWQDGRALTAADVAFTYRASVDAANSVPHSTLARYVVAVSACASYAVCVRLRQPYAPIIATFFGGDGTPILPEHVLRGYRSLDGAPFGLAPVGSGPYRVVRWIRGDRLDLTANAAYFSGKPEIDRITIRFVPNHATILDQLRTGEIDATFLADPSKVTAYRSLPAHAVVVTRNRPSFGAIVVNLENPVLRSLDVRRALQLAIDRTALARKATFGVYDANAGLRGLFGWAYDPNADRVRPDVAGARTILTRAGWHVGPDGIRLKDGVPLRLRLAYFGQSFAANAVVPLIFAQARAAGIDIQAKPYDVNALYASDGPLVRRSFQLALLGLQSDFDPDPSEYLACERRPPFGFNFASYCKASVDRALHLALRTYDVGVRRRLYAGIQRTIVRDVPYLFLWQSSEVDVVPRRLRGFEPSAAGGPYAAVARWRHAQ